MSTVKSPVSVSRTGLTSSSLATLASGTYCASNAYTCNTNQPVDTVVEVEVATTNTPAGNKQVRCYLQVSLDGTNFSTGPTSGTSDAEEGNLYPMGNVQVPAASTTYRKAFDLLDTLGFIPYAFKVITRDDLGVALTSGAIYVSEISQTVA